MALSRDDKEWVKLTAEKLVYAVTEGVIKEHIKSCPHGRSLLVSKTLLVGIVIGVSLCSGSVGFTLARFLL